MPCGALMSLEQCWMLATAWYSERLKPGWRRMSAAEMQAVFNAVGLQGEFWRL